MTGNPTTAVLVHGGTFTSTMWDAVRSHLSVPSCAVDLPGRRYKPADLADVTLEDWVGAVCDDIVEADLRDVALVGHSSGVMSFRGSPRVSAVCRASYCTP